MLGVPEADRGRNDDVFRRMLGLVRGRVYYNLLNWYRLLAMLPGFKVNRGFMEQMMGVKEAAARRAVAADFEQRRPWANGCTTALRLLAALWRLVAQSLARCRADQAVLRRASTHALARPSPTLDGCGPTSWPPTIATWSASC